MSKETDVIKGLDWSQRKAVFSKLNISNAQAADACSISVATLRKRLKEAKVDENFDVEPYRSKFKVIKRGRKSSKIADSYQHITEQPQPIEQFSEKHGVSKNIFLQADRFFTKNPHIDCSRGKVVCRTVEYQGSPTKCVWLEPNS